MKNITHKNYCEPNCEMLISFVQISLKCRELLNIIFWNSCQILMFDVENNTQLQLKMDCYYHTRGIYHLFEEKLLLQFLPQLCYKLQKRFHNFSLNIYNLYDTILGT